MARLLSKIFISIDSRFFDEKFNDLLDQFFPFTFSPLKQTLHLDLAFNNVNEYLDYKTLVSNLENLEIIQSMKLAQFHLIRSYSR